MKTVPLVVFVALLVIVLSTAKPGGKDPSIHTHTQEPYKLPIRHGKKRKLKIRRTRIKFGAQNRHFEKQYLVQNRTLALLGDEVQRILHTTKGLPTDAVARREVSSQNWFLQKNRSKSRFGSSRKSVNSLNRDAEEDSEELWARAPVNVNTVLEKMIQSLSNFTGDHTKNSDSTPCQKWINCKNNLQHIFLGPLPSCPCQYPASIFYENKIWDESQKKFFRWKDASGDSERLNVYKPGADHCIRSLVAHDSQTLSAQHCCYDRNRILITRGAGAGNPNFVSPDVSSVLHEKIDVLPWRLCKGDFTRYNKVRPPNNGNSCKENPDEREFKKQIKITTYY